MADVSVRPARLDDVAEINRIQRDTLAMAYDGVLPPEALAPLADPATRAQIEDATRAEIRRNDPGVRALVALEGGRVVGLAFARAAVLDGESALEDADPDPGATGFLEQILVEPRFGRRGHGSRLLAAAVEFFTERGFVSAVTWVPEQNASTTSFLTSAGWARDGYARGLDAGSAVTLREVRFHTALQ